LQLRRASLEDMGLLARLYRTVVRHSLAFLPERRTAAEDRDFFEERLFPTCDIWLAEGEEDCELLGYIALRPAFIEHLFVAPARQRQGIGARLLQMAMEGADELSLWTFQQNAQARAFYERHGFIAALQTDGSDNEENLPDVLYRWRRGV